MARYVTVPYTRKLSERFLSRRAHSELVTPQLTGNYITSNAQNGNYLVSGLFYNNINFTIWVRPQDMVSATFQWYMAASGRLNNTCTNNFEGILVSGSGNITDNVSSFTVSGLNGYNIWNTDNTWVPTGTPKIVNRDKWGNPGFYKCVVTNAGGSVSTPWVQVGVYETQSCNCICNAPNNENCTDNCCCFDCNLDGITCCDSPPGNPVSNCCRAECTPGDPGYACGSTCTCNPGGYTCDTCYYYYNPPNTGACS